MNKVGSAIATADNKRPGWVPVFVTADSTEIGPYAVSWDGVAILPRDGISIVVKQENNQTVRC